LTGFYFSCFGVTYLILINYGRDISSGICLKHLYEVDEVLEFKVVDKKTISNSELQMFYVKRGTEGAF